MATLWITYAWVDNQAGDIDFIAQELINAGVEIKLDRWNIQAGQRLWEQIERFIQNPSECDGWLLYATENSLGSEPCREEFAYALDRALRTRGETFPIIGLVPGSIDNTLIPAGIRSRLYVSLTDADWKERIRAAAEGRSPSIARPAIDPFFLNVHTLPSGKRSSKYAIEVRPRGGVWAPFLAGIPLAENGRVNPDLVPGARGRPPQWTPASAVHTRESSDGKWYLLSSVTEATPTTSYYIFCDVLPSKLIFGVEGGLKYAVEILQNPNSAEA